MASNTTVNSMEDVVVAPIKFRSEITTLDLYNIEKKRVLKAPSFLVIKYALHDP
ncbi:hypothetical protein IIO_02876 [Bacillus cereus VD115]|nr:hypothetical protein IIO_02876 [Bacillus cereus VD115]